MSLVIPYIINMYRFGVLDQLGQLIILIYHICIFGVRDLLEINVVQPKKGMEMKLVMMEIIMTSMIIIIVVIIIVIIAILIKSSALDQRSPRDKLLAFSLQRLLLLHWFRCVPPAEDGKSMPLLSSSSSSLTPLLSLYCHQYYEDDDYEN